MAVRTMAVRPNRASAFTYDKWSALARANFLVENYIRGEKGTISRDEIVASVATDAGVSRGLVEWLLV